MKSQEFKTWLKLQGMSNLAIQRKVSDCKRIEKHYGNLDRFIQNDEGLGLLKRLMYCQKNNRTSKIPIKENENVVTVMKRLKASLKTYASFFSDKLTYTDSSTTKEVVRALNNIGMHRFVKHYEAFEKRDRELLIRLFRGNERTYSKSSIRINLGIRIFEKKMEKEALKIIISNSDTDAETLKKAKRLFYDKFPNEELLKHMLVEPSTVFKEEKTKLKWNRICRLIRTNATDTEHLYQNKVINMFHALGWSRLNEIERNINSDFSNTSKSHIIVKNQETDLFVVATASTIRSERQLLSYLRRFNLNIGLLINDRIRLFYRDANHKMPVEIMNIPLDKENRDGLKFMELFSKQSFNLKSLIKYCKKEILKSEVMDYLKEQGYEGRIISLIKKDVSKRFSKNIFNLISEDLASDIIKSEKVIPQIIEDLEDELFEDVDYQEELRKTIREWI